MTPRPVTAPDSAWLRMEEPTNPMTITGIVGFDSRLDMADLERFVSERLVRFDRFAMRIAGVGTRHPRWVPDEDFDLRHHLFEAALPEPGGKAGLEALVSDLMSRPLSFAHSPWTFHLVHGVEDGGAVGSALVVRLHHVIGDGVALMHVLIHAVDEYFDPAAAARPPRSSKRSPGQRLRQTLRGAGAETWDLLTDPGHFADRLKAAGGGVAALGGLLAMRPDSKTVFKGSTSPDKRAAWTEPIPLDTVKAIGERLDAKVNDVLMAAAGGAVRRYLRAHGQPTEGVTVRVALPVNVRPLERAYELGNSFALFFVELAVAEPTARERLAATKATMDAAKGSKEPAVVFAILQAIGRAPGWAHRFVVRLFAEKASGVLTNVPGPQEPIHLMGARVTTMMFWVPQAGDIGLGIALLSLDGTVRVGVATDAAYVSDPSALARAFEEEFAALAAEFDVDAASA